MRKLLHCPVGRFARVRSLNRRNRGGVELHGQMADRTAFVIAPYDGAWPGAFENEAGRLWSALGSVALRIDHHGSTAVPGLGAKPIIDIQVSVAVLEPMARYALPLQAVGYVHKPSPDDAVCPFFYKPAFWPHQFHVHVVRAGGEEERRTLAFRDYLRDHGDAAREYEQLKHRLARQLAPKDEASREAYARAKTAFVEAITTVALASGYPRGQAAGT